VTETTDLREVVDVVIGVDTHVHTHSAAIVDAGNGAVLGEITVEATADGYAELVAFADQYPSLRAWAIEGTGGHGATHAQRQLFSLVIAAPEPIRKRFRGQKIPGMVKTATHLRLHASWDRETTITVTTLRALARRSQTLTAEAAEHERAILTIVRAWRPDLLAQRGVGPIVAATVLCAWSHPGRVHSEAAFAMLSGTAPIPATSGQIKTRHRLNRYIARDLYRLLEAGPITLDAT
jgi:transposase